MVGAEIDQDVAAQDQVEAPLCPIAPVDQGQEVLPLEANHAAKRRPQSVAAMWQARSSGGTAKPACALLGVQGAQGPGAELRLARDGERPGAEIGAEDRHGPVGKGFAEKVVHEDGEGVRLGPRGAAGTPDPQTANLAARLDQFRKNRLAQSRKLLGVAKEEGFADGDLGLECGPFFPTGRTVEQG